MSRPAAARSAPRIAAATIALIVAAALAVVCSIAFGARPLPLEQVWSALTHPGASTDAAAIVSSRIPRTVNGVIAGAALAIAGLLLQNATDNPLADSGLLGIGPGAAFAVVVASALGIAGGAGLTSLWALAGAVLAMAAVHAAAGGHRAAPVRLALAGAAIAAGLGAITSTILLRDQAVFDSFRAWQVGSLLAHPLSDAAPLGVLIALAAVGACAIAPALDRLALGDDVAASLGSRPRRTRAVALVLAALAAGAATTLAGPIAFVGLVVPHALRLLVGRRAVVLAPLSLLGGPVLVLAADTLGRVVAAPGEVPVGVMTAIVGAPVFLVILLAHRGAVR